MHNIAVFISEHGFGHASRACAVIQKIQERIPCRVTIFSKIPRWFFEKSLSADCKIVSVQADIGLRQIDAFNEDLSGTLTVLEGFYPFSEAKMDWICSELACRNIDLVISDVSPFGLEAADRLKIPSLLVENFTWDWIYESYLPSYPEFSFYINYICRINEKATFQIQTDPLCRRDQRFLFVGPIFRESRLAKEEIRERLGIRLSAKVALITMGGIPFQSNLLTDRMGRDDLVFVVPGADVPAQQNRGYAVYLPHNHDYFHPDLVHASDIVIGKIGYSTIAEVYAAQIPFAYLTRRNFRESDLLEAFVQREMRAYPIRMEALSNGEILGIIDRMLAQPTAGHPVTNGAAQVAQFVTDEILKSVNSL